MAHAVTDPKAAKLFVEGGKAVFTVVSKKTGTRFTYRIKKSKDGMVSFCSVRVGASYEYVGYTKNYAVPSLKWSGKSHFAPSTPEFAGLSFTLSMLAQGFIHSQMEFWHEGKCGCCGRPLTDPVSISRGIGPDCWARYMDRLEKVAA